MSTGVVHRTYGIALWKDGGVRRKIEDISTNKHHVKLMAGCMNRRRVASVHFEGVVEDMLACGSPRVAKNKSFSLRLYGIYILLLFIKDILGLRALSKRGRPQSLLFRYFARRLHVCYNNFYG